MTNWVWSSLPGVVRICIAEYGSGFAEPTAEYLQNLLAATWDEDRAFMQFVVDITLFIDRYHAPKQALV